ncbi:MAG: AAA family ATPase, partial [Gemmatimonadota bacterium]|nr:AAA family ATPase [Gemmatimonadota bacterium]
MKKEKTQTLPKFFLNNNLKNGMGYLKLIKDTLILNAREFPSLLNTMDMNLKNISAEMPIIGFTGALGSGCSFLAKRLSEQYDFAYYSLSEPIHEEVKKRCMEETSKHLQDIGNEFRKNNGPDYLVAEILKKAEKDMLPPGEKGRKPGIIVDGIRNTGEIEALRHFTHFYLISVQASQEIRKKRLMLRNLYQNEEEFFEADKRDAEEPTRYGQQVKQCNYFSDIIISNEENYSLNAKEKIKKYISEKLDKYIGLIMCLASSKKTFEHRPSQDEALMTAAYVESKRSSCLKRKVGAVISTSSGDVITSGHNDVPDGTEPCLEDPDYEWCARDVIQEKLSKKIKHCPACGEKINVNTRCTECDKEIYEFMIRCPNCKYDLELEYLCS